MAFMMPVMKNNYDIYKDSRSRKTSECSNASSNGGGGVGGSASVSAAMGTPTGRSRKVSECKSESFATSPSHHHPHHAHRMQMQRCQSSRGFPRNSSRTSHSSASGALSPTRSFCQASSPPKTMAAQPMAVRNTNTQNNNNNNNSSSNNNNNNNNNNTSGSQSDFTKFHLRLVDKLRKSFRKDTAKRS